MGFFRCVQPKFLAFGRDRCTAATKDRIDCAIAIAPMQKYGAVVLGHCWSSFLLLSVPKRWGRLSHPLTRTWPILLRNRI